MKPAQLAERRDFSAGPLLISPARRHIQGPAGKIQVEPLTMQIFLLLVDARGEVVTRDQLFDAGWGGALVGDDSLNRTINRVRRIATQAGPGSFEIETIPRTGYRLTGLDRASPQEALGTNASAAPSEQVSRRYVLGFSAAAIAGLTGIGLWSFRRVQNDRQFAALLETGERALLFDKREEGLQALQEALSIYPGDAKALGLMAYTQLGDSGGSQTGNPSAADQFSRAALKADPEDPYARLAETILQRSMLDVASTEDRLNQILTKDPKNISAMRSLWGLYQSVGLSRAASGLVERAMALQPLAPVTNYPRAQMLWILGRVGEADRVIDRAIEMWPWHRFVRFARFMIYAFTDRAEAARSMLDSKSTLPQSFSQDAVSLWRLSLPALGDRSAANIAQARDANLRAALKSPTLSYQAVMTLSALGEVDAAFDVANALLAFRKPGTAVGPPPAPDGMRSTAWRFTPWLFTPPSEALRRDPRFRALCDGVGLTDYWSKRGVQPDYGLGSV
ncbi:winged helix-turn-helix domain-containing protein [Sphingomonas daechungensis]|uniref:winged helix-turn-helix domain-containing protein n=1 Tax=Sphingomonas daechungensis TaxID=1176646 RepID=UPI003783CDE2